MKALSSSNRRIFKIFPKFFISGARPAGKDDFSDILGSQGFKAASDQPKGTLKDLQRQQNQDSGAIDPVTAKVVIFFHFLKHLLPQPLASILQLHFSVSCSLGNNVLVPLHVYKWLKLVAVFVFQLFTKSNYWKQKYSILVQCKSWKDIVLKLISVSFFYLDNFERKSLRIDVFLVQQ